MTCTYDPAAHTLVVASDSVGGSLTLRRSAAEIEVFYSAVNGTTEVPCAGGTPTVNNTDAIDVQAADLWTAGVDLTGGRLAPGFTDEGDGSSEVEIAVASSPGNVRRTVFITGSEARDVIRAGTSDGEALYNLNAGERVGDADLTLGPAFDDHRIWGHDGNDVLDARGGAGTGGSLQGWRAMLDGAGFWATSGVRVDFASTSP